MKKLSILLFAVIAAILLNSCSKEESKVNEPTTSAFTVYKNPTGDVNADALQAQNTDSKGTLNFYGAFDSENNPSEIRTLTYQKANNDTIVNLIIDPLTNRLASSYFSVKGVKSPIRMKLDYIDNSKNINVSYYNYNWITETSNLIYASQIENNNGVVTENPFYASKKIALPTFLEGALALGTGLAVAETVGLVAGTFTLSAAAAPIIAGVLATQIVTYAAIGVAVFCISNLAGAATYTPSNLPPPSKTPIINPVTPATDPTPNLRPSGCGGNPISFNATMDAFGSIMFSGIEGGVAPFTFGVGEDVQQTEVFSNEYQNGSYVVCVKDANGCMSCKLVPLKRELDDCTKSTLAVTTSTTANSATAMVTGGQLPYTYLWSNGSKEKAATNLTDGTYTVTVTDALNCSRTVSSVVGVDNIIGTWDLTTITGVVPLGEYQPLGMSFCGNVNYIHQEQRINSGQLVIAKNNGSLIEKHTIKNNNINLGNNCDLISDLPDSTTEKTYQLAFTYDENFFYITSDNEIEKIPYSFTNANTIELLFIGEESNHKKIYVKR